MNEDRNDKNRVIVDVGPYAYYDPDYPELVAEAAREFLVARDKYIAAWVKWHSTALGAELDAERECEIMQGILQAALERHRAEEPDGET